MEKVIISIVGVKRSGKSTTAEVIESMITAKNIAIADKLKKVCSSAFDLDLIHFNSQDLKEESLIYPITLKMEGLSTILESFKLPEMKEVKLSSNDILELATMKMRTPRHILQNVGMFIREVFGKDIHMKHLDLSSEITIVSDVRFLNEFKYLESLKSKGYYHIPIYVKNEEAEKVKDLHISEKEYLKFKDKCIMIDNDSKDMDNLIDQVQDILIAFQDKLI